METLPEQLEEINKEYFIGLMPESAKIAIIRAVKDTMDYVIGEDEEHKFQRDPSNYERDIRNYLKTEQRKRADESL